MSTIAVCDNCGVGPFAADAGHTVMDGPCCDVWCQACFDKFLPIPNEYILRDPTARAPPCELNYVDNAMNMIGLKLSMRAPAKCMMCNCGVAYFRHDDTALCGHTGAACGCMDEQDNKCWECRKQ